MFGKNAFTGRGQSLSADVAGLIAVCISMRIRCIGTHVLAADCTAGGAIVSEGVADAIKCRAAVLALNGAGVEAYVATGGICRAADGASGRASKFICVSKAGALAANVTNVAALGSRGGVVLDCGSLLAAFVTGGVARAVVGVIHNLVSNVRLAAVTANGAACCYGLVSNSLSVTGGASGDIAGCIASEGVGVCRKRLAAALNFTDTVAIKRIVIVANVIANSLANVTYVILVCIYVSNCLRSTAGIALLIVAKADPNVLLASVVSATVVTELIACIGVSVCIVVSYEATGAAGAAASEFIIVKLGSHESGSAAKLAGNGAFELVYVLCLTRCITVGALGRAIVKPCMLKSLSGAKLFTNVTLYVAKVGVGVRYAVSYSTANGAGGGALGSVGVLQIGADRFTNEALGSAVVLVGVSERCELGFTNGADGAVAGLALMFNHGSSFHGVCTAITERIAIRGVLVALGTEATRKRKERKGNG